ncbi:MAG: guanylate kinase [Gammaproteobacteria bacterium]|nr:guanylate kinase [Gammaproteobacteria bacterium]
MSNSDGLPHDASSAGTLFVVSAPSGAGKTSLVRQLVARVPNIQVSVSHTTRARRPKEIEGEDYHFVDTAKFEQLLAAGEMLEHAQVFDHYYGTSRTGVLKQLDAGVDVVLEIDWQGAQQIRQRFPACVSLEVFPPSLETLDKRLRERAQDSEETIARRMRDAVEEMSHFREYDFLIINDDFETALADLITIVNAERLRLPQQAARHQHRIDALLAKLDSTSPP